MSAAEKHVDSPVPSHAADNVAVEPHSESSPSATITQESHSTDVDRVELAERLDSIERQIADLAGMLRAGLARRKSWVVFLCLLGTHLAVFAVSFLLLIDDESLLFWVYPTSLGSLLTLAVWMGLSVQSPSDSIPKAVVTYVAWIGIAQFAIDMVGSEWLIASVIALPPVALSIVMVRLASRATGWVATTPGFEPRPRRKLGIRTMLAVVAMVALSLTIIRAQRGVFLDDDQTWQVVILAVFLAVSSLTFQVFLTQAAATQQTGFSPLWWGLGCLAVGVVMAAWTWMLSAIDAGNRDFVWIAAGSLALFVPGLLTSIVLYRCGYRLVRLQGQ